MNASTYIVAFHIGRGGRFHNQGHKSFVPHINQLSDCFSESSIIFREDEEGNPLPDQQWQLIDGGGVAPFVGAWIETSQVIMELVSEFSRTLCGCVD